ncbi:hypothetical protein HS088_TW04G00784 [Tripterygium wilfordii]|uniref:Uncharacterized protein n=1 Tax=Tripterygium wilfordii TaxID=458696 RepID=A0A7J7DRP7_TRIWF|nr:hypothetical protein HS088_TW04G00772 [Tripterygium wilfordii]KAF5748824.1 hypothetical protein HS088_TW04G00784 [Tripterygium wilfordii]
MEIYREVPIHDGHQTNDKEIKPRRKEKTVKQLRMGKEKGDINELVDAFIKHFHNQLKYKQDKSMKMVA